VADFLASRNWPQKKLAGLAGISPTTLNQFINATYKGDFVTVAKKLTDTMKSVVRREKQSQEKKFVETSVVKRINAIIVHTDSLSEEYEGAISLIIGDSGHGKSVCLRAFADANLNAIYVEVDTAMNATAMFAAIAQRIRIDSDGTLSNLTRRLISALEHRRVTIIIDEASGLSVSQLNLLRTVIVGKCRCPLVLSGNNDLLKTVNQSTTRRGFESLDQFRSRMVAICNLDELAGSKKDDGGFYSAADIRAMYEYGGVKLSSDAAKTLRNIARTPQSGRLRTCSRIIAALHCSRVVEQEGTITGEHIIAAIEELDLPVRVRLPLGRRSAAGREQKTKAG